MRLLATLVGLSFLFILTISVVFAATDTITIQVTVSELTIVDIYPPSLTWTAVPPGGVGVMKSIQIENMGSTNITKIWFNNSYPSSYPFGSGNVSKYNAGNFVVVRRNSTNADYFFPNRVEYNESGVEIYLTLPSNWKGHGRFRNSSFEYFWVVVPGTSGNCSDGTFSIGVEPHTNESTGSTDLTNCQYTLLDGSAGGSNNCRSGPLTKVSTSNGVWGYADLYIGGSAGNGYDGDEANYTVAVNEYCNVTWFYHWNMDAPGAGSSSHAEYFSEETLYPGAWIVANVRVYVPYGVAAGNVNAGTLTVIAST